MEWLNRQNPLTVILVFVFLLTTAFSITFFFMDSRSYKEAVKLRDLLTDQPLKNQADKLASAFRDRIVADLVILGIVFAIEAILHLYIVNFGLVIGRNNTPRAPLADQRDQDE